MQNKRQAVLINESKDTCGLGAMGSPRHVSGFKIARRIFAHENRLKIVDSALDALEGVDALAIVTEWAEFRSPDFALLKKTLKTAAIFDGRNLYDPAMMKSLGFEYFPVGRKV